MGSVFSLSSIRWILSCRCTRFLPSISISSFTSVLCSDFSFNFAGRPAFSRSLQFPSRIFYVHSSEKFKPAIFSFLIILMSSRCTQDQQGRECGLILEQTAEFSCSLAYLHLHLIFSSIFLSSFP